MRGLLGRLSVRTAVVVGIGLLVLGIVSIARLSGGESEAPTYRSDPQPTVTVDPTSGDDGEVLPPTTYPDDAAVTAAAKDFTTAWLRRDLSAKAWLAGITPMMTAQMAEHFAEVQPSSVPANRIVSGPVLVKRTELLARTSAALDTGTLTLELSKSGDDWLVESVDWVRL